ncbi:MAG TPA: maleylacetate reductase [Pilimelia sp.]|nr:maleylacetate reductase [Pilimelia sp.]
MTRPIAFTYQALPGRVIFGVGAVDRVGDEVAALPARRALLITSESGATAGKAVAAQLGRRHAGTIDRVAPHVPEELAMSATRRAVEVSADVIVSVGGGSATGLAKAVAARTGAPVMAVPTTYAGSEVTPVYGITGARKVIRRDPRVLPRVVVYDPALTLGLPARTSGASGFNALAHCVEAFWAPRGDPVTDMFATEGARRLAAALPRLESNLDDLDVRAEALLGAYFAGVAFAGAGSGLHHKLCHILGGDYGLVHAEVHAVLLPHVVAFQRDRAPAASRRAADALGCDDAATWLYDLGRSLGVPDSLARLGLPADALDDAVRRGTEAAAQLPPSRAITGPEPVGEPAIRALLDAAFAGRRPDPR